MRSAERRGPVAVSATADNGSLIEIFDVIAGCHAGLVETLVGMHRAAFPEHDFVSALILDRASTNPTDPTRIVPHQWVVQVDGDTVGYFLFDSNVARGVALSHYVHLSVTAGALTFGRTRLLPWVFRRIIEQLSRDCGDRQVLGLVGEAPEYRVPIFRWIGLHDFGIEYYEPIHGPTWKGPHSELRRIHLLWMPPDGADDAALREKAQEAGAAAFLLDFYRFEASEPWVARAVGSNGG